MNSIDMIKNILIAIVSAVWGSFLTILIITLHHNNINKEKIPGLILIILVLTVFDTIMILSANKGGETHGAW